MAENKNNISIFLGFRVKYIIWRHLEVGGLDESGLSGDMVVYSIIQLKKYLEDFFGEKLQQWSHLRFSTRNTFICHGSVRDRNSNGIWPENHRNFQTMKIWIENSKLKKAFVFQKWTMRTFKGMRSWKIYFDSADNRNINIHSENLTQWWR